MLTLAHRPTRYVEVWAKEPSEEGLSLGHLVADPDLLFVIPPGAGREKPAAPRTLTEHGVPGAIAPPPLIARSCVGSQPAAPLRTDSRAARHPTHTRHAPALSPLFPAGLAAQIVEYPIDASYEAIIISPSSALGLPRLVKALSALPARWALWTGALRQRDVSVRLPAFRIEAANRYKETLRGMGAGGGGTRIRSLGSAAFHTSDASGASAVRGSLSGGDSCGHPVCGVGDPIRAVSASVSAGLKEAFNEEADGSFARARVGPAPPTAAADMRDRPVSRAALSLCL